MALSWPNWISRKPKRRSHAPEEERYSLTPPHTTEMFERHIGLIDLESATKRSSRVKPRGGQKSLSMAWDDTSLGGLGSSDLIDDRIKKDTYYKVYCGNQWISGCVNVTMKRMTSGGWECVETVKDKGKAANEQAIKDLLDLDNLEEDFIQLIISAGTDVLTFGEGFCELGYAGNTLTNLYMIDGASMTTHFDIHGAVTGYTQRLEKSTEVVTFEPDEIIRWWLPDLKAKKKALSPIELLKDPVWLDRSMTTWGEKFFRQGGKPSYWVEMGPDSSEEDGDRYVEWWKENYTGIENAHLPPVMYAGAQLHEFGKGSIELDFDKSDNKQRDRVLVVYGVPPAMLNIIETASLGGGTGESQDDAFLLNTVEPLEKLIMEKFNHRVIRKGMGIKDWEVKLRHADYRSDKEIAEIEDKSVGNGTLSRNEARQERGRSPIEGGDVVTITTGNVLTPVSRLEALEAEQAQQAELSMQGAKTAMQRLQGDPSEQDPQQAQDAKGKVQPDGQKIGDAGQNQEERNVRGHSTTRTDILSPSIELSRPSDVELEQHLFEQKLRRGLCLTLKV